MKTHPTAKTVVMATGISNLTAVGGRLAHLILPVVHQERQQDHGIVPMLRSAGGPREDLTTVMGGSITDSASYGGHSGKVNLIAAVRCVDSVSCSAHQ